MRREESGRMGMGIGIVRVVVVLMVWVVGGGRCDIDKDKEKCANELVGLAPCLAYVSGESKSTGTAPPAGCCAGLKQVLHNSPQCLCLLVKDRNDPGVGFKINATIALTLPSQCHSPANISDCPAALHLPPNSPDAKVFQEFANSGNAPPAPSGGGGGKTAAAAASSSSSSSSSGDMVSGNVNRGKRVSWIPNIQGLLLVLLLLLVCGN